MLISCSFHSHYLDQTLKCLIHSFDRIYFCRVIINEKATVTDRKVTARKFDEKEASVNDKKAVVDKRTKGYPDGGPFNPEEHRVFSAWVRQHEAELFQS